MLMFHPMNKKRAWERWHRPTRRRGWMDWIHSRQMTNIHQAYWVIFNTETHMGSLRRTLHRGSALSRDNGTTEIIERQSLISHRYIKKGSVHHRSGALWVGTVPLCYTATAKNRHLGLCSTCLCVIAHKLRGLLHTQGVSIHTGDNYFKKKITGFSLKSFFSNFGENKSETPMVISTTIWIC